MPIVPTYQPGQVRNDPQPALTLDARATPDSFGARDAEALGGIGAGLQRVSASAGSIAVDMQDTINKNVVRDTLNEGRTNVRDYINNDLLRRQGMDAAGAVQDYKEKSAEVYKGLDERMQNGVQRDMLKNMWSEVDFEHTGRLENFSREQVTAGQRVSRDAENQSFIDDAKSYWNDPALLLEKWKLGAANTSANFTGMGEAQKGQVQKWSDHFFSEVADTIAFQDPLKALAFLHDPQFSGKMSRDALEVETAKVQQHAKAYVARATAIKLQGMSGMTPEGAQNAIDLEVKDPETAALAMSEFNARFRMGQAAQEMKQRASRDSAWDAFSKTNFTQVPEGMPGVTGEERLKMLDVTTKMAERTRKAQQESDPAVYNQMLEKTRTGELANENLWQHAAELSPADMNQFRGWKSDMLKGEMKAEMVGVVKGEKMADSYIKSFPSVFGGRGKLLGGNEDRSADQTQKQQAFRADVSRRIMQMPVQDRMDENKIRAEVDDLMTKAVLRKGFFSDGPSSNIPILSWVNDHLWKDEELDPRFVYERGMRKLPEGAGFPPSERQGSSVGTSGEWESPEVQPTQPLQNSLPDPLKPHASTFESIGKRYGVDPALLASIAAVETGRGTSRAFQVGQNAMGVSTNAGPVSFKDRGGVGGSIEHMAQRLANAPEYAPWRAAGGDASPAALAALGSVYAPPGASNDPNGTNSTWAASVGGVYSRMTGGGQTAEPAKPAEQPAPKRATPFANDAATYLDAKLGVVRPPTFGDSAGDVMHGIRTVVGDIKQSAGAVVDVVGAVPRAIATIYKGNKWMQDPTGLFAVGKYLAEVKKDAFPSEIEMNLATRGHVALSAAGVSTDKADEIYKAMNTPGLPYNRQNTPRGYVNEIGSLLKDHSKELAAASKRK